MTVNWGDAVCASGHLDFVSVKPGSGNEAFAIAECQRCPIMWSCLEAELSAMRGGAATFGVVGGFTAAGRREMLHAEGRVVAIHTALSLSAGAPKTVDHTPAAPVLTITVTARRGEAAANGNRKEIVHGEASGAQAHRRRGEKPCPECAAAWRAKTQASVAATRARQRAARESADMVA